MSSYTWNGISTNWNFGRDVHKLLGTRILFKTSSKVTSKKPQIWTGQHFRPKPLFKSYSRHHQKLLTKKPQIWTGPHFRPKPLLKSFSRHHQKLHPKNPKFELDHILDQNPFLVFWTNIACKWCNLFLRTFGYLHFWEGFQGLELGGTRILGEYQNRKRDQNLSFSYATWMNFSKKYIRAVVLGNLLVGKAFKGKA